MFSDIGEPLTDSLKILYMKGGIRPEAGLEASIEVAKGLPNVNSSFDLFVNHITESVTNKRSRAEVLKIIRSIRYNSIASINNEILLVSVVELASEFNPLTFLWALASSDF